jgi:hypothetical protein
MIFKDGATVRQQALRRHYLRDTKNKIQIYEHH